MKRILCAWLPRFPIQRLHRQPELKSIPIILYRESGNRAQVTISSRDAIASGVRSGTSLAEAQALCESATFIPHDIEADTHELHALALLMQYFSPTVGLEQASNSHCLLLDITGCAHLFGDEFGLTHKLIAELARYGYFAHVAVAKTIGAAWGIARYGHGTASDRRLRSLPVEALRIPDKLVRTLQDFDLQTIGQIRALPRDSLPSRFGTILTDRLDQMFGQREELPVPVSRPKPVSTKWVTEEPIRHLKAIEYICENLLEEILETIRPQKEGLLLLTLVLKNEGQTPAEIEVRLAQPTDSHRHVMSLLNLKLETTLLPEWVFAIEMEASIRVPLRVQQRSLFDDDQPADDGDVRRLIDRLSARLGQNAVVRPGLLPEATPERAVSYEPLTHLATDTQVQVDSVINLQRPLNLFPNPEPVSVVTTASGSPVRMTWNRRSYRLINVTKAERIATDWWQETGSICRDYYQAEADNGSRFWLYRDRTGDWFLHGIFE